jgi:hypothetical protein
MEVALAIIQIFKDAVATILIIFLVWFVLAVMTSQIQEWIFTVLRWRAVMLEDTITQMLGSPLLKDKFYNHPLIKGLYTDQGKYKPGGIPEDKFALVLFEMVLNSGITIAETYSTFEKLKRNVTALKATEGDNGLKDFAYVLDTLLIGVEERADDYSYTITEARQRVESWFDNAMERLSGSYRRRVQLIVLIVGITLAGVFNVDTAAIANTLWKDSLTKQAIATQASQLKVPGSNTPASADAIIAYINQSQGLSLPIGWSHENIPVTTNGWMAKIAGILFSGMMAAQGAPYFFDFMRKTLTRNPPVPPQPA